MSALVSAVLAASAVLAWLPTTPRDRLGIVLAHPDEAAASDPVPGRRRLGATQVVTRILASRSLAAAVAGVCLAVMLGGVAGVVGGAGTAVVLSRWLGKLEPGAVRRRRERLSADLPISVDLLAASLEAGLAPDVSLRVVAAAVGGPVAEELRLVSARLALGADPLSVWAALAEHPVLAPLARSMTRAAETGAPVAPALFRLADDQLRAKRWEAEQRARSVGVKAAAPLALCFLPAFVAVGVVPTVVSSFQALLG